VEDLHATVTGRLRRIDQRYTTGRRALVEVLAEAGRPVTIGEIVAGGRVPAQSTAYRNLAVLEQAGVVRRVQGHDEFSRYELAEDLTGHHHHMVCVTCGAVEDFTMPSSVERNLARVIEAVSAGSGFKPEGHRLDLLGTCAECV